MELTNSKTLGITSSLEPVRDSMGIVLKDFEETGNNTLGIYIPRFMFAIKKPDGDFKAFEDNESLDSSIIKNSINKNIGSSSVQFKNYLSIRGDVIPGLWQPKYVKGERLKVVFIDQDIKSAHFLPFGTNDSYKRKVDRVRIGAVAKEDEMELDNDENSYFLELDASEKKVRFHTSDANGENNPFNLEFDTAGGKFTFKDFLDSDRGFEWDVNNDTITFQTEDGAVIKFSKSKVSIKCEEFEVKAENKINLETTQLTIKADVGNFNIDSEKHKNNSFDVDSGNVKIKSNAFLQLKTLDSMLWKPNVVMICPFGFPHGGLLGLIPMLKG